MSFPFTSELNHFFGAISVYRIYGVIPLGMILHITISAAITIILLKQGMKFKHVCLIVFLVGLSKEIMDCFVLNNTLQKHIMDMSFDMSYPAFLYLRGKIRLKIRKMKSKYPPKTKSKPRI